MSTYRGLSVRGSSNTLCYTIQNGVLIIEFFENSEFHYRNLPLVHVTTVVLLLGYVAYVPKYNVLFVIKCEYRTFNVPSNFGIIASSHRCMCMRSSVECPETLACPLPCVHRRFTFFSSKLYLQNRLTYVHTYISISLAHTIKSVLQANYVSSLFVYTTV